VAPQVEHQGWAPMARRARGVGGRALIVPGGVDEDEPDEPARVAVYCPECAMWEFGRLGETWAN
jgi:hypothetical protein